MSRLAALKSKLAAREGKAEFAKNCEELRAEIARIEAGMSKVNELDEFIAQEAGQAEPGDDGSL